MKNFIKILVILLFSIIIALMLYLIVTILFIKSTVTKIDKKTGENEINKLLNKLRKELGLPELLENFENSTSILGDTLGRLSTEGNISGFNNGIFSDTLKSDKVETNNGNINTLTSSRGTINTFSSNTSDIANLNSTNANFGNTNSTNSTILGTLNSVNGNIDTLTSSRGTINTFSSNTSDIATLNSTNANFGNTNSTNSTISGTLNSTNGTINTLNSTNGTINTLNSTNGTINTLNSTNGTINTLNSTNATVSNNLVAQRFFTNKQVPDPTTGTLSTRSIRELTENYFDIDMRGLDSNGDFIYRDNEFYPMMFMYSDSDGDTDNKVLNFTILGHVANNYNIDNSPTSPTYGLYSKTGTFNIFTGYTTVLTGYIIVRHVIDTIPYGEISYISRPVVDQSGNDLFQNIHTKCFGPICFPEERPTNIHTGPLSTSIGSVTGNIGNPSSSNTGTVTTLRVNGRRINGKVSFCLYVRGARRYIVKTNASYTHVLKDGGDIIDLPSSNPLLYAASRYNILRIRNDRKNLGDPLLPLENGDVVLPSYTRFINLNNPNAETGSILAINYFTVNKNGKYIYSRNNDSYFTDFVMNGISLNNLNKSVKRAVIKYDPSSCNYNSITPENILSQPNQFAVSNMTIIPFVSSIDENMSDTFEVIQRPISGITGTKSSATLLNIKRSGFYKFHCSISFRSDLTILPDIYLFGLYNILRPDELKSGPNNTVRIVANNTNIGVISPLCNTSSTCTDSRYFNNDIMVTSIASTTTTPVNTQEPTLTVLSTPDTHKMMISGINTSAIYTRTTIDMNVTSNGIPQTLNSQSIISPQRFPPIIRPHPNGTITSYGLSFNTVGSDVSNAIRQYSTPTNARGTYAIELNKESISLVAGLHGIFIMIGNYPNQTFPTTESRHIASMTGYIEYIGE